MTSSHASRGTVRRLERTDEEQLFALFQVFAAHKDVVQYFHPHPFDRATASKIAGYSGLDTYLGYFTSDGLVGYAMLRGWDEGYEVPTFGVAVSPAYKGVGVGGELLRACLRMARERGAKRVRLKVYEGNERALRWYRSIGFERVGTTDDGQWVGELPLEGTE